SSTRTEIAAAPAPANCAASFAGSASGRRSPAEGERRFTSAIACSPGRPSAWANLMPAPAPAKPVPPLRVSLRRAYGSCRYLGARERNELFEAGRGSAGVEGLPRDLHSLPEVLRVTAGRDRAGCVEQNGVSRAAALAVEDAPDRRGVL